MYLHFELYFLTEAEKHSVCKIHNLYYKQVSGPDEHIKMLRSIKHSSPVFPALCAGRFCSVLHSPCTMPGDTITSLEHWHVVHSLF